MRHPGASHPEYCGTGQRRGNAYAAPFQRPKGSVGVGRTLPPQMNAEIRGWRGAGVPPRVITMPRRGPRARGSTSASSLPVLISSRPRACGVIARPPRVRDAAPCLRTLRAGLTHTIQDVARQRLKEIIGWNGRCSGCVTPTRKRVRLTRSASHGGDASPERRYLQGLIPLRPSGLFPGFRGRAPSRHPASEEARRARRPRRAEPR